MLIACSLVGWSGCALSAGAPISATDSAVTPAAPLPGTDAPTNSYIRTLKELGKSYSMNLKGAEATDSVNFNVRADEVVTAAQVTLQYSYSPALLADLSQINVLVNDQVAASLPLPKEEAGKLQTRTVQIPPQMITEFNRLSLQFIGHYTMQCEDPLHSSLWARIGNESQLSLQVSSIKQPNDLSALPQPLFDRRDASPLKLPFVFASRPGGAELEAAGILSSWFGALASYRGATFPASLTSLPAKGNAVVFVSASESATFNGLPIQAATGPTVTLISNPNDAQGKLLIVSGRDGADLKIAATALALGGSVFSGQSVVIDRIDSLKPRQPYDAPNWLPSDRPVRLGELAKPAELNVSGYNPGQMAVALRLPPDLFNWREPGAQLDLKYRYTPQPIATNSSLLISFNDTLIKSVELPSIEKLGSSDSLLALLKTDESLARTSRMLLPLNSVALQSKLQFRFMYEYLKQGECRDIIIDNMRGVIDPDSTLDLSDYDHFMAMPNLGVFKDSGFPFTRMADLSETSVILPDDPGPDDLGAYLTLLGRFGESTGYPATGVKVVNADQIAEQRDRDLLVLASGNNQPLQDQWQHLLPAKGESTAQYFELSDLPLRLRNWISPDAKANLREARSSFRFSAEDGSAYLTGFESPLQSGRSVVFIASARPNGMAEVTDALLSGEENAHKLQGSLVVVRGKHVESLAAEQDYYVGQLGPLRYLQWYLSQNVVVLLLVTLFGVLLLASMGYLTLRKWANRRLGR
ncbi:cellulose biosynthesis cyclic di-GMP-binding regulatory protein BcsB [Pseudomonas frederiksbergensis]|uniref:cellulose biosynthesis cyclic di-GMP-binding regulatory protein BcsB n=1 Tax=Pseudomonas frederiksbergensis TaxID=104087 RepID=UPI00198127A7|nr:cellulose biosynthesis cyclic di-GMP-binding regulatory protein BcsB [Pseudomonas frederiksbergensis]MBN3862442.1 cellulose biosynthesis cyclic di-GMP-binding regulatory protein BcsB [Pseudomonas frederiksbergensis]